MNNKFEIVVIVKHEFLKRERHFSFRQKKLADKYFDDMCNIFGFKYVEYYEGVTK